MFVCSAGCTYRVVHEIAYLLASAGIYSIMAFKEYGTRVRQQLRKTTKVIILHLEVFDGNGEYV